MDLYLKRTLQGLVPADEQAEEALRKVPLGDSVRVKVTRPRDQRSIQQHRLYWKLCQVVFDNTEGKFASAEKVSEYLKIQAGHYDQSHIRIPVGDGFEDALWLQPRSISFEKMGHTEFQDYWKKALDIICSRIITGMDKAELESEVYEMIGGVAA